jgi:hypothetical protein
MQVWASYEDTISSKRIHAIPYFVFTPSGRGGGPFRDGDGPHLTVRGPSTEPRTVVVIEYNH